MRTALYKPKFFAMRYVPHSEFEALRRFPDYELLIDGTLSRVEPDGFEYRVIDETAKRHFPIGVLTTALQKELHEYYGHRWREKQNANPDQALDAESSDASAPRKPPPLAQERSQEELF